ncbi:MAG: Gfo/Idh/MocA family oxidoreductase [Planctomycetaceae bacterium]|nr:Gfo/Idh/MocA family oxidoreductase [Planctomycetaceae bacterium]
MKRRDFLKSSAWTVLGTLTALSSRRVLGANENIRVGIIGVGRQGSYHAERLSKMAGVQLVALADPDPGYKMGLLQQELAHREDNPLEVDVHRDFRALLDRKDIDAVVIVSCNHWHSLHSILALQAGKHVYVEKPVSHTIWEGRQLVNMAKKSGLVVQAGLHHRSRACWPEAIEYLKQGHLGKVICSCGLCYKQRDSIGLLESPASPPSTCDYDLWLGPAQEQPIRRPQFHYDWHWLWNTGDGDLGNQGVHQVDIGRWMLGQDGYPEHVLSIGGRFGYKDAGETPNTQIVFYDYKPVPMIFEVRGLPAQPGVRGMSIYKKTRIGNVLECEGGYIAEETVYDKQGKKMHTFSPHGGELHLSRFIEAVRNNTPQDVPCSILDGHISSALCHLPNISHQLGAQTAAAEITEKIKADVLQSEAWARFLEHLRVNQQDLEKNRPVLGAALTFDGTTEQFTGDLAAQANPLARGHYRPKWQVPAID